LEAIKSNEPCQSKSHAAVQPRIRGRPDQIYPCGVVKDPEAILHYSAGSPNKHGLGGNRVPGQRQHSPVSRFSPGSGSVGRSHWKANPTMVISPNGRRMPLEEAVTLVSYLAGSERGTPLSQALSSLHTSPPPPPFLPSQGTCKHSMRSRWQVVAVQGGPEACLPALAKERPLFPLFSSPLPNICTFSQTSCQQPTLVSKLLTLSFIIPTGQDLTLHM